MDFGTVEKLFYEACGKSLDLGVSSIHCNELVNFANLCEEYAESKHKAALKGILSVGPESDEWDAVERVLPKIERIAKLALGHDA